jgi:hypothetical protein
MRSQNAELPGAVLEVLVLLALLVLPTDFPLDGCLVGVFLGEVSINPFIFAEANVSVYAMRSKKAFEVFRD